MSQYTEEEQIALIKDWWQRNGKPLLVGVALAVALIFGWQAWKKQEQNQAEQLSAIYQQLLEVAFADEQPELDEVLLLVQQLEGISEHSAYTQYARLALAKVAVEQERFADAAQQLTKVTDKPATEVLGELALHRLARVMIIQGEEQQALALLNKPGLAGYQPARDELRGDIELMLGEPDKALDSYQRANAAGGSQILQMKIDDLAKKDA